MPNTANFCGMVLRAHCTGHCSEQYGEYGIPVRGGGGLYNLGQYFSLPVPCGCTDCEEGGHQNSATLYYSSRGITRKFLVRVSWPRTQMPPLMLTRLSVVTAKSGKAKSEQSRAKTARQLHNRNKGRGAHAQTQGQ